jgi:hypothetical protein
MVSFIEILGLLLGFSPIIVFMGLLIGYQYFGGKKAKAHLSLVDSTIRQVLKNHVDKIEGPLKLKNDVYEFRCVPKSKKIGILTLNYSMVNRTLFTSVIFNKLLKEKEKLFIGCKFRVDGRDVDPGYKFHAVPYHRKNTIRRRFDEYVVMDDIPTSNPKVEKNFMIKSGSAIEVEHFVTNETFQSLLVETYQNVEVISLTNAKEDTDPHLQATFTHKPNDLKKLSKFIELFFLITSLHLSNQANVLKNLQKRKDRGITSRTKSARKAKS